MSAHGASETLAALAARAPAWRALSLGEKADILQRMLELMQGLTVEAYVQCSRESAATQCLDPEELGGVVVILEALIWIGVVKGHLERLRDTLRDLADGPMTGVQKNNAIALRQRSTCEGEAGAGGRGQG